MKSIASRQNPIVAHYRSAARGDAADVVLLDGVHLVVEALEAGIPLHDVAVASDATGRADVKEATRALIDRGVDFVTVSASVIDAISPVRSSSPIVALACRPSTDEARLYRSAAPLATVARGGRSVFDVDYTGPVAILIGGEGPGLPESIVGRADERVTIPMRPPVESLNAAVTAALIVYEAHRQRR